MIDTFLFAGEIDLLEIRLRELEGIATQHVAIASFTDLRGRPLDLPQTIYLERRYPLQVVRIPLWYTDPFFRENEQRSFADRVRTNGLMLHGDVDEIPRASDLEQEICRYRGAGPVRLRGDLHQLCLDWRLDNHLDAGAHPFAGPVLTSTQDRDAMGGVLAQRRNLFVRQRLHAGWHLQWCMSPEENVRKANMGHHVLGGWYDRVSFWQGLARYGTDPLGRWRLTRVPIDDTFPRAVWEEPDRWRHLMIEGQEAS